MWKKTKENWENKMLVSRRECSCTYIGYACASQLYAYSHFEYAYTSMKHAYAYMPKSQPWNTEQKNKAK